MLGVIVIGAGPGIGLSVAKRFAREGLPVGVVARSLATVDAANTSSALDRIRRYSTLFPTQWLSSTVAYLSKPQHSVSTCQHVPTLVEFARRDPGAKPPGAS